MSNRPQPLPSSTQETPCCRTLSASASAAHHPHHRPFFVRPSLNATTPEHRIFCQGNPEAFHSSDLRCHNDQRWCPSDPAITKPPTTSAARAIFHSSFRRPGSAAEEVQERHVDRLCLCRLSSGASTSSPEDVGRCHHPTSATVAQPPHFTHATSIRSFNGFCSHQIGEYSSSKCEAAGTFFSCSPQFATRSVFHGTPIINHSQSSKHTHPTTH